MSRNQALAQLKLSCAPDVYPTLAFDELDAILDGAQRFTVWAPSTSSSFGQVVQPTVPNGHLYRAIVGGIADTTEPTWPLYTAPDERIAITAPYWDEAGSALFSHPSIVQDGTVVWQEAGFDAGAQYDLRSATYQAWMLKIAKASADYDASLDGDGYKRSQVLATLHQMATRYLPTRIA